MCTNQSIFSQYLVQWMTENYLSECRQYLNRKDCCSIIQLKYNIYVEREKYSKYLHK